MKNISKILALTIFASAFVAIQAQASSLALLGGVDLKVESNAEVKSDKGTQASSAAKIKADVAASSTKKDNAMTTEQRGSEVSTFVKSLLSIADREKGIGAEVREVARAQNDSASTSASAMVKVENRGSFKKFLIGDDYRNLGVIRSEAQKTKNNIEKLESLLDKTTTAAAWAELNVEIDALEEQQATLEAYVEAHESTFSVFGWFTKLFVKTEVGGQ
ncbi:MAG: hypothetical protein AAB610_03075 [Patescibacteria group bacterium]